MSVLGAVICLLDPPLKTKPLFSQMSSVLAFDSSQLNALDKGRCFTQGCMHSLWSSLCQKWLVNAGVKKPSTLPQLETTPNDQLAIAISVLSCGGGGK